MKRILYILLAFCFAISCEKEDNDPNNAAPSQPSNITPINNATSISTSPNLSWSCTDPENDPLTYDLFFGTTNPPTTKISSAQIANSISRSSLSSGTKYYWSVVAKDNHNNSTSGPVWNFTTQAVTGSAPEATFTATPIIGTAPLTVSFTDQSSNDPTSWSWNFGDGGTVSTEHNPSHTYSTAGTYTVSLSATNSYGSNTATKTNYITVNTAGTASVAAFSATPTSGTAPLTVNFTDQSTNDPISWSWNFGDGSSVSTEQNPSHTYSTEGPYTVSLTATNSYGTDIETKTNYITITSGGSSGNIVFNPDLTYGSVSDVDGNTYKTIQIGDQVWMAENLKYLPSVVGSATGSGTTPYYYVYGYNGTDVNEAKATSNYSTYGVLYNWTAAMDGEASSTNNPSGIQGVCPTGWHLPSDAEWTELNDYLGGTATGKLKETGTTHWTITNTGVTNETGFTALPGGGRNKYGPFFNIGYYGYWWSATEGSAAGAWSRAMDFGLSDVGSIYYNKEMGFSVRCVKD